MRVESYARQKMAAHDCNDELVKDLLEVADKVGIV
jgi:hypothetical protein